MVAIAVVEAGDAGDAVADRGAIAPAEVATIADDTANRTEAAALLRRAASLIRRAR